jgi:hypothetical protein
VGIGVAVGDGDSSGEPDVLRDADSSGSTFVKYGELFAATYQSGAASNFFYNLTKGSKIQN